MKRLFAWLIMSLMGITLVMPSFVQQQKQDEPPTVVQVENEEDVTPTVVPDEPTPEPEVKTDLIIPDSEAITWTDALNDYIDEKKLDDSAFTYTLQGSGTQADPYQISNAYDLAYFAKTSFAAGTYFELTDDIILNDGYFEEDGTYHDGGDGKLYEWKPNTTFVKKYFDGKTTILLGCIKMDCLQFLGKAEYTRTFTSKMHM